MRLPSVPPQPQPPALQPLEYLDARPLSFKVEFSVLRKVELTQLMTPLTDETRKLVSREALKRELAGYKDAWSAFERLRATLRGAKASATSNATTTNLTPSEVLTGMSAIADLFDLYRQGAAPLILQAGRMERLATFHTAIYVPLLPRWKQGLKAMLAGTPPQQTCGAPISSSLSDHILLQERQLNAFSRPATDHHDLEGSFVDAMNRLRAVTASLASVEKTRDALEELGKLYKSRQPPGPLKDVLRALQMGDWMPPRQPEGAGPVPARRRARGARRR